MANNFLQYHWSNQVIGETTVNSIRVRIFISPLDVISNNYEKVVATDGQTIQRSPHTYTKHTQGHSYVVLSTGITERFPGNSHYIYVKVYLTNHFNISSLENVDFLEKEYVITAIQKYLNGEADENTVSEPKPALPPLLNYLRKRVDDDYEEVYQTLKSSAQTYEFDKVEELFKTYKISAKYQALFWKEMYQETAKKEAIAMRENWKNFKFRYKGLLKKHYPFATVNVKIYQKNHKFFLHEKDLEVTDGNVRNGIVDNFSYVIVVKCIQRREANPETHHLDIKVYLAFDFNPKHLPKISDFWGEYLDKAISKYLVSPKISQN